MSGDKRSVSTDALETLGTIIDENAGRDAIHVAVEPCVAAEIMHPGQHVKIVNGEAVLAFAGDGIGIVDPFLKVRVNPGEHFWMLLYPRTITSLRHVWSHPAFEPIADSIADREAFATAKAQAEAFLRNFCEHSDAITYDELLALAFGEDVSRGEWVSVTNEGEYIVVHGSDAGGDIPDEVWLYVEIVTGKRVTLRAKWFSCSC